MSKSSIPQNEFDFWAAKPDLTECFDISKAAIVHLKNIKTTDEKEKDIKNGYHINTTDRRRK